MRRKILNDHISAKKEDIESGMAKRHYNKIRRSDFRVVFKLTLDCYSFITIPAG